jgi:hypothetical protein
MVQAWRQGNSQITIFFDSLDEGLLRISHIARVISSGLRSNADNLLLNRISVRIVCRTAEWPSSFETQLKTIFGEEHVGVYELAPLRLSDAVSAAQLNNIDASAFTAEVDRVAVGPLAARPITLQFLLNQFQKLGGSLPRSKTSLYEAGCLHLCAEPDAERREAARRPGAGKSRLRPEQLLIVASRIAVAMLLGNRSIIRIDDLLGENAESEVTVDRLIGGSEDHGRINVNERSILDCLGTSLLTSRGEDRLGWAHHTYAEFLAARYLARVPLPQIKSLMSSDDSGRIYVTPQLHEVAAWLAGMRADVLAWIKEVEPEILLRSDAAEVDDATREGVVGVLIQKFGTEELIDTGDIRAGYERLRHPRLVEQLTPAIQDRARGIIARRAAIDIAEACQLRPLQNVLVDVALDESEEHPIRTQAAHAVWRVGDDEARGRLSRLAIGESGDDPNDDLRGIALRCLWPGSIAAPDVVNALVPPKKDFYIGHYEVFLHDAPREIPEADLPVFLNMLAEWPAAYSRVRQLAEFQEQVMRRGWEFAESPGVVTALAKAIVKRIRLDHHVFDFKPDDPLAMRIADDIARRRLVMHAILDGTGLPRGECVNLIGARLLRDEDGLWMLEQIQGARAGREAVWARCIGLIARGWASAVLTERILTLRSSLPALATEFDEWLDAWELDSPRAQTAKAAYYEQKKREEDYAPKLLDPPPSARISSDLERIEAGEVSEWINLVWDLTLTPTSTIYHPDLTSSPVETYGWKNAEASVRARIISTAKAYLLDHEPGDSTWLGTSSLPHAVIAGRSAFQLLLDDKEFIAAVPTAVCDRWAPTLIGYPAHGDPWSTRAACFAYGKAKPIALDSLRALHERNASVSCLKALKGCWDDALTDLGLRWLKSGRLSVEGLSDLGDLLLSIGNSEAAQYLRHLVVDGNWRAQSAEEMAVAIYALLLLYDTEASWPLLSTLLTDEPVLAQKVMSHAAKDIRHGEKRFVRALTEQQLRGLYVWLRERFPSSVASHVAGSHYVTEGEMIRDLRREIIETLVSRGTYDACAAISGLIDALAEERRYLSWRLRDAVLNARRAAWRPPAVEAVISLLQVPARRYIASARDLLDVILESLSRLQLKLNGTPPAASDLWNYEGAGNRRDRFRPKDEEDLSDYVTRWLAQDLGAARGIIANREVQPRRGQKTDVWIVAVTPQDEQCDTYTVVIEAKGCWNADLGTAMKTQLVERYLNENALRHGVYLVGWFLCDRWDDCDRRKQATPGMSIDEAKELFQRQAADLGRQSMELRVEAVVLDVTV